MTCSSMSVYPQLLMPELDPQDIRLGQAVVLAVGLFLVVSGHLIWWLALWL
jgi:hypothetical protein